MIMNICRCNSCGHEFRVPENKYPTHPDRCPACEIFFCGEECCGDEFSASFVYRVEMPDSTVAHCGNCRK
jgi:DNA replicative helicase MCM subunit Mcm2 (Cdc46/Mcm family)